MSSLFTLFVVVQVCGAFIGVVGAVWSELAYVHAAKDGTINKAERAHLQVIAHALRFGMLLLLLASSGLVVLAYLKQINPPALTDVYWIFMMLALLIIVAAWALSRNRMPFVIGSGVIFSGWWFLLFLTIGQLPMLSFGEALGLYTVITTVFCGILWYTRRVATRGFHQKHIA